jgi:putative heme-binding domain-containing protein
VLVKLLDQPELAPEAIRGLAAAGQPESAALLIDRYASLPSNTARAEAMNALVSRTNYALALLEAIQRGRIKRTEVNASQLRQLRTLKDEELKERIASVWPQLDSSPSGKQAQFARLKKLLAPDQIRTANAAHGRQLFQQTCAVCHKLFGEGAQIGPDLTGSDRANVDYLLDNIVDPSGIVPESYRVSNISLKDGRLIAGIVLSRTPQTVTVQTTSEKLSLEPGAIESITESRLSMMPEGLLDAMSDQDVKDLGAYLMSPNPVPLPSGGR